MGFTSFPYASQLLFENYGYNKTMGILAGIESVLIIAGIFYEENNQTQLSEDSPPSKFNEAQTNKSYVRTDEDVDESDSSAQTAIEDHNNGDDDDDDDNDVNDDDDTKDKFYTIAADDKLAIDSDSLLKELCVLLRSMKVKASRDLKYLSIEHFYLDSNVRVGK